MTRYIGKVSYRAHSATPIVMGDLEVMKRWPGAPEGEVEGELELGDDSVLGFAGSDLAAPHVFARERGVALLIPPRSYGRKVEAPEGDALQRLLDAPLERVFERYTLAVRSGALVITVAYNATPEEGAPTSHLNALCFHQKVPRLPRARPAEAVYATELALIPVPAGSYAVEMGSLDGYDCCRLGLVP